FESIQARADLGGKARRRILTVSLQQIAKPARTQCRLRTPKRQMPRVSRDHSDVPIIAEHGARFEDIDDRLGGLFLDRHQHRGFPPPPGFTPPFPRARLETTARRVDVSRTVTLPRASDKPHRRRAMRAPNSRPA